MSGIDWGSAPDWLAGCAAFAALIFAGIGARAALATNVQQSRQLEHLEQQNRQREDDLARRHAANVAAWIVPRSEESIPFVYFVNGGNLPVYDVRIVCHTPYGRVAAEYAVRGPDPSPVISTYPTKLIRELVEDASDGSPEWLHHIQSGHLRAAVRFMDSDGRWWVRSLHGRLIKMNSSEEADAHLDLQVGDL